MTTYSPTTDSHRRYHLIHTPYILTDIRTTHHLDYCYHHYAHSLPVLLLLSQTSSRFPGIWLRLRPSFTTRTHVLLLPPHFTPRSSFNLMRTIAIICITRVVLAFILLISDQKRLRTPFPAMHRNSISTRRIYVEYMHGVKRGGRREAICVGILYICNVSLCTQTHTGINGATPLKRRPTAQT